MIAPKRAHLVERAAERLLKLGGLEESAAHLLEPGRGPTTPPPPGVAAAPAPVAPAPAPPEDIEPIPMPATERAEPAGRAAPAPSPIAVAALRRAGMFDWSRGRSRISEEFRLAQRQILRTAFGATAAEGVSNIVMVTSARPGEGKSFTALNLAGSAALQGDHPILLIDSDLKRGSICYALGLADAPGLLDLAADPDLEPTSVIRPTEVESLMVLPLGQDRSRASDLFASPDMTRLIQRLGRQSPNRLLIIDAVPCLPASDPPALASSVGQVLFVVEAEKTQREEVEAALQLIQSCPHIMLLLNKVQVTNHHTFGANSSYRAS